MGEYRGLGCYMWRESRKERVLYVVRGERGECCMWWESTEERGDICGEREERRECVICGERGERRV